MGFNSGFKGLNVSEVTHCEVLRSCCSVAEDSGVLECYVMLAGKQLLTF